MYVYIFRIDAVSIKLSYGGESGIRTHGTLPYDGFQDRSVITTSVSLRITLRECYYNKRTPLCQCVFCIFSKEQIKNRHTQGMPISACRKNPKSQMGFRVDFLGAAKSGEINR